MPIEGHDSTLNCRCQQGAARLAAPANGASCLCLPAPKTSYRVTNCWTECWPRAVSGGGRQRELAPRCFADARARGSPPTNLWFDTVFYVHRLRREGYRPGVAGGLPRTTCRNGGAGLARSGTGPTPRRAWRWIERGISVAVKKKSAACALEHRASVSRWRKSDFPLRARPGLPHWGEFRCGTLGCGGAG